MFATVLPQHAQATLAVLGKSGLVKDGYLAGGSALALHFNHRYSVDFDFFTQKPFDPHQLSQSLSKIGTFKESFAKGVSLIGELDNTKLSYFLYDYPLIEPLMEFANIKIAHPHDIAAMKLVALMDRGTKRDFVDLFELTKHGINVEEMFSFYEKKYIKLEENRYSLITALGYFDDAEMDEMPQMIKKISWEEVKKFLAGESMRLAKKYLE